MDKSEYTAKCKVLLQDASVYQHLSKTQPQISRELIKTLQGLQNKNFIFEIQYTLLRSPASTSPAASLYGLSKIHKNNMPLCSIVST